MKDRTNIIPFPKPQVPNQPSLQPAAQGPRKRPKRWNPSLATTVCSIIAVALASGVTNSSFFKSEGMISLASRNPDSVADAIFGDVPPEERDANWEKSVAESLASAELRQMASVSYGHEATLDESVRFGVLQRKYTVLRDLKSNQIESITYQDKSPDDRSMLTDRPKFLGDFGKWITDKYSFAELKSSELLKDHRYESYTIYDMNRNAFAIAKFELDNFQRLISFTLKPL